MTRTVQVSITTEHLEIPDDPPKGVVVKDAKRELAFDGGDALLYLWLQVSEIPWIILAHWLYDKYFKAGRKEIMIDGKRFEFESLQDLATYLEQESKVSEEENPHGNHPAQ